MLRMRGLESRVEAESGESIRPIGVQRAHVLGAVAVAVLAAAAAGFAAVSATPEIDARLEPLRPLLGKTWRGSLASPDGTHSYVVVRRFEPVAGGKVIKITKENPDLGGRGEGFLYWDDVTKRIRLFFIEESGVFLEGSVTSDGKVITFEGTMTWPNPPPNPAVKQRYEFRNTFEMRSDTTMLDSWFQDAFGPWRPGHVIEFAATSGVD